jgi:hypothetical protein
MSRLSEVHASASARRLEICRDAEGVLESCAELESWFLNIQCVWNGLEVALDHYRELVLSQC